MVSLKSSFFFFFLCVSTFIWASGGDSPQILCKETPLFDEEIVIKVVGLEPNQYVKIQASWVGMHSIEWVSEGFFQADEEGVIDLSESDSLNGTYFGTDPMGLFWSMEMRNVLIPERFPIYDEKAPEDYHFLANEIRVLDRQNEIAKKMIYRRTKNPNVEVIKVKEQGLIGNLYLPPSKKPSSVVIVLTGSNGGIESITASLLASNGIAALALAYSGIGHLPPTIEEIPIEYFENAFEWIENHPKLNGKIALYGSSRGAELSLLLGSMFPEKIQKIVAKAPSSVILSKDSWVYENEIVLPAAPYFVDVNNDISSQESRRDSPVNIRIHRERGLFLERERFEAASIPVEYIKCPIMLISGEDDQLGPSTIYAELILDRLEKNGSTIETIHLDYPGAGHLISLPYLPRINICCFDGTWMNFGGNPFDDEQASRDSWKKTLKFLKEF